MEAEQLGTFGLFVDRQSLSMSAKLSVLVRCREEAERLGHRPYLIFPVEMRKIQRMDGLFIRTRTDILNSTYVASRMAELHGIPVIDDSRSIRICSDKVNMYLHLMHEGVAIPPTELLKRGEDLEARAEELFSEWGEELILKEPSTSYSARVRKVDSVSEFLRTASSYLHLSDELVAQQYIDSEEDWRIGVLNGRFLFASRYIQPSMSAKPEEEDELVYYGIEMLPRSEVPSRIIDLAVQAASAIGNGLYSVDVKESEGRMYVIEVNDNPSLENGEERLYPDIIEKIILSLMR